MIFKILRKKGTNKISNTSKNKFDNSNIPKNTLRLIERLKNLKIKLICNLNSRINILFEKPHSLSYQESTLLNFPFIT